MQTDNRFYLCNPLKNTACRKTGCMVMNRGECCLTTSQEFAARDDTGTPIALLDVVWREENEG